MTRPPSPWLAIRSTLPTPTVATLVVAALIMIHVGSGLAGSVWNLFDLHEIEQTRSTIGAGVLLLGLLVHGFGRFTRRHPACRPEYCGWLWMTPWRLGRPLPLGPVHFALGDALTLLAAWGLSALMGSPDPIPALAVFFAGYVLAGLIYLAGGRAGWFAYGLLFVAAGAVYSAYFLSVHAAFVVLGAGVVWTHLGVWWSLAHFPWDDDDRALSHAERFARHAVALGHVTWPLSAIGPTTLLTTDPDRSVGSVGGWYAVGIVKSVLVTAPLAVWLFVGMRVFHTDPVWSMGARALVQFGLFVVAALAAKAMLDRNEGMLRPPLSLLGRIATGRLIIPRHDAIYLAPLGVTILSVAIPFALHHAGVWPPIACPVTVVALGLIWAFLRIDRERWALTAPVCIGPPKAKKKANSTDVDVGQAVKGMVDRTQVGLRTGSR